MCKEQCIYGMVRCVMLMAMALHTRPSFSRGFGAAITPLLAVTTYLTKADRCAHTTSPGGRFGGQCAVGLGDHQARIAYGARGRFLGAPVVCFGGGGGGATVCPESAR